MAYRAYHVSRMTRFWLSALSMPRVGGGGSSKSGFLPIACSRVCKGSDVNSFGSSWIIRLWKVLVDIDVPLNPAVKTYWQHWGKYPSVYGKCEIGRWIRKPRRRFHLRGCLESVEARVSSRYAASLCPCRIPWRNTVVASAFSFATPSEREAKTGLVARICPSS